MKIVTHLSETALETTGLLWCNMVNQCFSNTLRLDVSPVQDTHAQVQQLLPVRVLTLQQEGRREGKLERIAFSIQSYIVNMN